MATVSESVSTGVLKRTNKYKGCVCRDCKRIIGQEYNGEMLLLGSMPVSKHSRNVTCRPCRDQPVCEGGCERREIPDDIKLVQTTHGKMCRDCISDVQRVGVAVKEVRAA